MKSYVNELAIGVQFLKSPLSSKQIIELYWNFLKSEFPEVQDHPYLPTVKTSNLLKHRNQMQMQINSTKTRKFFISVANDLLIQVQDDKLYLNWRKLSHSVIYPGFNKLFAKFQEILNSVNEVVPLLIDLKELTYVNKISHKEEGIPKELITHSKIMPKNGNFATIFNEIIDDNGSVFTFNLSSTIALEESTIVHLSLRNDNADVALRPWFESSQKYLNEFYLENFKG